MRVSSFGLADEALTGKSWTMGIARKRSGRAAMV